MADFTEQQDDKATKETLDIISDDLATEEFDDINIDDLLGELEGELDTTPVSESDPQPKNNEADAMSEIEQMEDIESLMASLEDEMIATEDEAIQTSSSTNSDDSLDNLDFEGMDDLDLDGLDLDLDDLGDLEKPDNTADLEDLTPKQSVAKSDTDATKEIDSPDSDLEDIDAMLADMEMDSEIDDDSTESTATEAEALTAAADSDLEEIDAMLAETDTPETITEVEQRVAAEALNEDQHEDDQPKEPEVANELEQPPSETIDSEPSIEEPLTDTSSIDAEKLADTEAESIESERPAKTVESNITADVEPNSTPNTEQTDGDADSHIVEQAARSIETMEQAIGIDQEIQAIASEVTQTAKEATQLAIATTQKAHASAERTQQAIEATFAAAERAFEAAKNAGYSLALDGLESGMSTDEIDQQLTKIQEKNQLLQKVNLSIKARIAEMKSE